MHKVLCQSHELCEGECKSFKLGERNIFVLRHNGTVHGFVNSCPHLGIPLNWQADRFLDSEGELIVCASHGAMFLPDSGLCVSGPCVGRSLTALSVLEKDQHIIAE